MLLIIYYPIIGIMIVLRFASCASTHAKAQETLLQHRHANREPGWISSAKSMVSVFRNKSVDIPAETSRS